MKFEITKVLKSVKMRDARKFMYLGMAVGGIIKALDVLSNNVMVNNYKCRLKIAGIIDFELSKQEDNKNTEVIDVVPNCCS